MSSWVSLLVLLAACVRFGGAEGDPLPAALVELVRTSPISSIEDLQLLLFSDSVEGISDSQSTDGPHTNTSYIRLPRSLEAQPAQQAQCKVRTEVTEVTRGMLDRSNANFLLWPPCVEVQRCSGCCNTKSLHCVPVLTHTRYLQVMRIQYINKRPHYDKAVVSVSDHVECRCEPAPRSAGSSKKKNRQSQKERASRSHSKEELHRHDQLKHNQRFQLEDLLKGSPWQHDRSPSPMNPSGWDEGRGAGDFLFPDRMHHGKKLQTQSSGNNTASPQREEHEVSVRGRHHGDSEGRWGYRGDGEAAATVNSTAHARHHPKSPAERQAEGPGVGSNREGGEGAEQRGDGHLSHTHSHTQGTGDGDVETQIHHPVQHRYDLSKVAAANKKLTHGHGAAEEASQSAVHRLSPIHRDKLDQSEDDNLNHKTAHANQTPGVGPTVVTNQNPEHKDNPTEITNQWTEHRASPTELTNQRPTGNETPGWERRSEEEREGLEEERRELLLLHQRLDEEKELLKRHQKEEEEEKKDRRLHHLDTETHYYTTTMRTDTTASASPVTSAMTTTTTTTTTTATAKRVHRPRAPPRPPLRPHPPQSSRRRKKHRNRISKAAMRAMLM